jgi:hypothetical protein
VAVVNPTFYTFPAWLVFNLSFKSRFPDENISATRLFKAMPKIFLRQGFSSASFLKRDQVIG